MQYENARLNGSLGKEEEKNLYSTHPSPEENAKL